MGPSKPAQAGGAPWVGSRVEPGVALGVLQELPVPVVVLLCPGLGRAWLLLRVAHLAPLLVALEHDIAIRTPRGAQVSTLGGGMRGAVGAGDDSHEVPAQQHKAVWRGLSTHAGKLWRANLGVCPSSLGLPMNFATVKAGKQGLQAKKRVQLPFFNRLLQAHSVTFSHMPSVTFSPMS